MSLQSLPLRTCALPRAAFGAVSRSSFSQISSPRGSDLRNRLRADPCSHCQLPPPPLPLISGDKHVRGVLAAAPRPSSAPASPRYFRRRRHPISAEFSRIVTRPGLYRRPTTRRPVSPGNRTLRRRSPNQKHRPRFLLTPFRLDKCIRCVAGRGLVAVVGREGMSTTTKQATEFRLPTSTAL